MRRRILIGLAVLVVALVLGLVVRQQRANRRATYQGKHARDWALQLYQNSDLRAAGEATTAIQALGSNAVPALCSLLQTRTTFSEKLLLRNSRLIPAAVRRYLFDKIKPGQSASSRIAGARTLGLLRSAAESAVPDLIEALTDKDVRWAAAQSLACIGGSAIPALATLATNKNAELRHTAVYALGESGTNAASVAATLFDRVLDTNESVRVSAMYSLSRAGPGAIQVVLENLASTDPARRAAASTTIKAMNNPPHQVLKPLLEFSTHASPGLRKHSLEALQILQISHPRVIASYVRALNDPDPGVRCVAAQAMNQASVWATNTMLSEITARALGLNGKLDSNIIASLSALLNDPEPLVRATAQQALTDLQTATAN